MVSDVAQSTRLAVQPTLADLHQLQTSRTHRDQRGAFFVEGVRNLVAAVDHGLDIEALVVSERLLRSTPARQRVRALRRRGVPTLSLTPEDFRGVSRAERASGVAAVVRQRWSKLHQRAAEGSWVVLERVRSPGNLGSLIRSSSAFGSTGFVLLGEQIDPFDPTVVRATMGALFGQALIRTTLRSLTHWVRRRRAMVVGASPDASQDFRSVRYRAPALLVLGDERKGLSPAQRQLCQRLVRIPMANDVDSLNVAVAGSMLLYELRQGMRTERRHGPTRHA